jgi:hypothetical protein
MKLRPALLELLQGITPTDCLKRKDGLCSSITLPAVLCASEIWHLTLTKKNTFWVTISVFWVTTTCSLVYKNQIFGGSQKAKIFIFTGNVT